MKDGQPFMGLSTPGGDQQIQSLLQIFLNVVVWGMSPEQAVDQPTVEIEPGLVDLAPTIGQYPRPGDRYRGYRFPD